MHVLMLGWEFPPFITGGLGTACFGLTRAMDRRGTRITFVLPKSVEGEHAEHVTLISPQADMPSPGEDIDWITIPRDELAHDDGEDHVEEERTRTDQPKRSTDRRTAASRKADLPNVEFIDIPARFSNPYQRSADDGPVGAQGFTSSPGSQSPQADHSGPVTEAEAIRQAFGREPDRSQDRSQAQYDPSRGEGKGESRPSSGGGGEGGAGGGGGGGGDYDGDIVTQAERYARFCLAAARDLKFDIIHAHDWLTYPAGLTIARLTGKPLVVHIHSTEFDRSGEHVNQRIYDIERRGMHGAMRVIAVSQLTKNVVMNRYGLSDRKVEVVYNGVDLEPSDVGLTGIRSKDKIVLYFGRITYQKGPEYFIQAAKRVLDVMPDVKFVVAGSGDQAKRMIELAAELGIGHKVLFTGFLRGDDIKRVFNLADLYVMPSVSEPFGIAPLEAMSHNVPALISKTSGVSEVLSHALKVDFWDVDDMANKIIAVLKYPPLSQTLREHGAFEVRKLTWDGAAHRCEQVYRAVIGEMTGHAVARA